MANRIKFIKAGMAGSRNGRGRWEKTETLKFQSKHQRRRQGRDMAWQGKMDYYANRPYSN